MTEGLSNHFPFLPFPNVHLMVKTFSLDSRPDWARLLQITAVQCGSPWDDDMHLRIGSLELLVGGSTSSKSSDWSPLNVIDRRLFQLPYKFCLPFPNIYYLYQMDASNKSSRFDKCPIWRVALLSHYGSETKRLA